MLFFKIYNFFWVTKPSNCSATCAVVVSLRMTFWPQLLIYFTGLLSVLVHTTVNKHALKDIHTSSPYNDIITAVVKYCAVDIIFFKFFCDFPHPGRRQLIPSEMTDSDINDSLAGTLSHRTMHMPIGGILQMHDCYYCAWIKDGVRPVFHNVCVGECYL